MNKEIRTNSLLIPRRRFVSLLIGGGISVFGASCRGEESDVSQESSFYSNNKWRIFEEQSKYPNQSANSLIKSETEKPPAIRIFPEFISIPKLAIQNEKISEAVATKDKDGRYDVSVPNYGIATPPEGVDNLPNVSWIYGHSFYKGRGIFASLDKLEPGDQIYLNGKIEDSGEKVNDVRFIVDHLYLADKESGGVLAVNLNNNTDRPVLLIQTSVRENNSTKWLFNRNEIMSRTINTVVGDLDDPKKYLLLFVGATIG